MSDRRDIPPPERSPLGYELLSRADTPTSHRPSGSPDTIVWWHLATAIDVLHMPIVIALVVLGASWFSGPVFVGLLTLMIVLQIAVLGCPVMWLTGQLRKVHDPQYEVRWSVTSWLYHRYGPVVGIGVFVTIAALTLALRAWLF